MLKELCSSGAVNLRKVALEDQHRRRVVESHGLASGIDVLDDHLVSLADVCE